VTAAMVIEAARFLKKWGPVAIKAEKARRLVAEMTAFVREHKEIDGITPEQRAEIYDVLTLHPAEVKL
jgi:hypothetical protein